MCNSIFAQNADTLYVPHTPNLSSVIDSLDGNQVSLSELVGLAIENNIDLQSYKLSAEISRSNLNVAKGNFMPILSSTGSYSVLKDEFDTKAQQYTMGVQKRFGLGTAVNLNLETTRSRLLLPQDTDRSSYYSTGLSLGIIQPLLEGAGRGNDNVLLAKNNFEASLKKSSRFKQQVIALVELAYWALGEAEAQEAVFIQSKKVAEVLLFRNIELNRRGLATDLDVLTAESGFELRRSNLIDAQRARLDAAEDLIHKVYGANGEKHLRRSLPIKTIGHLIILQTSIPYETAKEKALNSRHDLQAALIDLKNKEISLQKTRNTLLPKLDLQANGSTADAADGFKDALDDLNEDMIWSAQLVFSDFIGGGVDREAHKAALYAHEQQQLNVSSLEIVILQEVQVALRALQSGLLRLKSAKRAADLAGKQLEAEQKRLELGLGDSFRILQTEQNAAQAALNEVRARIALARASTQYNLSIGKIEERY